ncbi:ribonuclease H-like YkuK family protein [Effusibacillus consociatus]|uniref:Ribonuclease H-like YkuK family protein n=1 Tax=Effusibacillus consociatus TaxID=1117041 RepID=A0ABV9Q5H0_9BACL
MQFLNPTKGTLTLDEVIGDICEFVGAGPDDAYKVVIGSDSQNRYDRGITMFVTAIIVHRVGKGARYYIHRRPSREIRSLKQRMFTEASYSLLLCQEMSEKIPQICGEHLEIHLDVGEKGATKSLIKEIVGWVTASGYTAKVKPNAFGASKVADRYTRSLG